MWSFIVESRDGDYSIDIITIYECESLASGYNAALIDLENAGVKKKNIYSYGFAFEGKKALIG